MTQKQGLREIIYDVLIKSEINRYNFCFVRILCVSLPHEKVLFCHAKHTNLRIIIAI